MAISKKEFLKNLSTWTLFFSKKILCMSDSGFSCVPKVRKFAPPKNIQLNFF